jgi:protein lysine acetyltransferase
MTGVRAPDLASLALFAGSRSEELAALAARLQPLRAAPGDVLMRQGDPAFSFVLLADGRAAVTRTTGDGEALVADLGPGMILGELSLLRRTPRAATVNATEPVTGYVGDEEAFVALLEVPGVAERLTRTARQRTAGLVTPVPVRLRDGTGLLLRPVLPGDREVVADSLDRFSPETLHRRFHVGRTLTDAVIAYLCDVDYVDHFVWVAVGEDDHLSIGDARFIRDKADPTAAEVAFMVADDFQGRGVGTLLLGALSVAAQESGVRTFQASVLAENRPMRRILERAGATWRLDGYGVVETTIGVPAPHLFLPDAALVEPLRHSARRVLSIAG